MVVAPKGRRRMHAAWLTVTVYMQTQVLTGFIYQPHQHRLLDLLNGVFIGRLDSGGRFVELSDAAISHADGRKERLPTAYINKATIQLVVPDGDLARGIGAKVGPKPRPFVQKSPVLVRLQMPAYTLIGSVHCASGQKVRHVLQEKLVFLPVTNVKIRVLTNGIWRPALFAAVNREQILSVEEEEIAPSSSPST